MNYQQMRQRLQCRLFSEKSRVVVPNDWIKFQRDCGVSKTATTNELRKCCKNPAWYIMHQTLHQVQLKCLYNWCSPASSRGVLAFCASSPSSIFQDREP